MNLIKKFLFSFKRKKKIFFLNYKNDKKFIHENLKYERILGIDTEFDWRNTYFPNLCLIQIATKKNIFLIDCLGLREAKSLEKILCDKELLIFHSVRSDTTVLSSALNIKVKNVYDIQLAENILSGNGNLNYGSIVKNYFPVKLKKSETNSNWSKRPLTKTQMDYAADDVEYLIDIFYMQKKKLNRKFETVISRSRKEAILGNKELYVPRLKKIDNASDLEKKIFLWREKIAMKKNVPPSYIFKDKKIKLLLKSLKIDKSFESINLIVRDNRLALSLFEEISL
tara:strand:+ start:898 stop:1746 length:849 start_codon:yes stop_codon:yes gene_type:complete